MFDRQGQDAYISPHASPRSYPRGSGEPKKLRLLKGIYWLPSVWRLYFWQSVKTQLFELS